MVEAFAVYDDGAGADLYVAGQFTASPAGDSFLARYQGCPINSPPTCPPSTPVTQIWPPNHKLVEIDIAPLIESDIVDPDGDEVTIEVTSITQDEPINGIGDGNTTCDAAIVGGTVVQVRSERARGGNGRVYRVEYAASDPCGSSCTGTVEIHVPANQGDSVAIDDGNGAIDSTQCMAETDLNGNGRSDFGDLLIALETYGQSGPDWSLNWPDGDVNGDGTVDLEDLVMVLEGITLPAGPAPETDAALGTE